MVMVLALTYLLCMSGIAADAPQMELLQPAEGLPRAVQVDRITEGPKHHFFGYYGMPPWDATGRYMVCLETEFGDRPVAAEDTASLLLLDLNEKSQKIMTGTHAWNFQQGCLMQWLPSAPDRKVIYNDRIDGALNAVIMDVFSGEKRLLPRPIAAVSHDGKLAASINYARLAATRPGYGYAGVVDPWANVAVPRDDGLYVMDLNTGEAKLIASLEQVYHAATVPEAYRDKTMWLNHVVFSRDDKRIFFLGRFQPSIPGPLITAAFTIAPDGAALRCVLPYEWGASHFDWLDGKQMAVVSKFQAGSKWLHVFFTDGAPLDTYATLAPETLQADGHCHFSPDGKWMVTDSYPSGKQRMQRLYVLELATQKIAEVARFNEPANFKGEWRCDLHPRWSRDGRRICIDSTHEGTRQLYAVKIAFPEETHP